MARISGIDIPKDKRGAIALTYIYGIGKSLAMTILGNAKVDYNNCLLYTSPSPRDRQRSRMPSSA